MQPTSSRNGRTCTASPRPQCHGDGVRRHAFVLHGRRQCRAGRALEHPQHGTRHGPRSRFLARGRMRTSGGVHAQCPPLLDVVRGSILWDRSPLEPAAELSSSSSSSGASTGSAASSSSSSGTGGAPANGGYQCTAITPTNWDHVTAGRATRCGVGGSYVCAVGSNVNFGLWTVMTSTLAETSRGYYVPGSCP